MKKLLFLLISFLVLDAYFADADSFDSTVSFYQMSGKNKLRVLTFANDGTFRLITKIKTVNGLKSIENNGSYKMIGNIRILYRLKEKSEMKKIFRLDNNGFLTEYSPFKKKAKVIFKDKASIEATGPFDWESIGNESNTENYIVCRPNTIKGTTILQTTNLIDRQTPVEKRDSLLWTLKNAVIENIVMSADGKTKYLVKTVLNPSPDTKDSLRRLYRNSPVPSWDVINNDSLRSMKVVVVVGANLDKASYDSYTGECDRLIEYLNRCGITVAYLKDGAATWDNLIKASEGASIFVYMGHGMVPSWPTAVGGICLHDGAVFSERIKSDLRLKRGADVLFSHTCYSAGASALDTVPITFEETRKRVLPFAEAFIEAGADLYYANNTFGACLEYLKIAFEEGSDQTIDKKNLFFVEELSYGNRPYEYLTESNVQKNGKWMFSKEDLMNQNIAVVRKKPVSLSVVAEQKPVITIKNVRQRK